MLNVLQSASGKSCLRPRQFHGTCNVATNVTGINALYVPTRTRMYARVRPLLIMIIASIAYRVMIVHPIQSK